MAARALAGGSAPARTLREAGTCSFRPVVLGVLHLLFPNDAAAGRDFLFAATFCLLASMGRSVVVLALDVAIERRTARSTPRIFRDLSTGVIYLLVGLVALRSVGVEPGSILTTSALLTAVVGLAMQDTLGNLVSGLALQLQPPFDVGDWIEFDGGQQAGRVTEITWRATSVMTLDHVEVILPNATLAKAAIRNYSRPSTVSRRRVNVGISYAVAPSGDAHAALVAAAIDVPGRSRVAHRSFAHAEVRRERRSKYDVMFFIDDFGLALRIDSAVRDRVYYELARRGFQIPFPIRQVAFAPAVDDVSLSDASRRRRATASRPSISCDLSQKTPAPSSPRARAALRVYGPGEAIVRKGDRAVKLFVIERGAVSISKWRATEEALPGRSARRRPVVR